MRRLTPIAFLLAAGCSTWPPVSPPQIIGQPSDPKQFAQDVAFCQAGALAYNPSLSLQDVAVGAVSGAAQNATGTAISPLVPALGAAAGATSSLASGLDVMGQARNNVMRHCLIELTHRDKSAVIADPT